jgi:hypothetical protein
MRLKVMAMVDDEKTEDFEVLLDFKPCLSRQDI